MTWIPLDIWKYLISTIVYTEQFSMNNRKDRENHWRKPACGQAHRSWSVQYELCGKTKGYIHYIKNLWHIYLWTSSKSYLHTFSNLPWFIHFFTSVLAHTIIKCTGYSLDNHSFSHQRLPNYDERVLVTRVERIVSVYVENVKGSLTDVYIFLPRIAGNSPCHEHTVLRGTPIFLKIWNGTNYDIGAWMLESLVVWTRYAVALRTGCSH